MGHQADVVINIQPTVAVSQVTENNTVHIQPVVNIAGNGQEMSKIPSHSQPALSTNAKYPAEKSDLSGLSEKRTLLSGSVSSNKQAIESYSVFNQPSTNSTTIQPAVNTATNRQPVDNNTSENTGGSNTTGKMSGDPRKSRSDLCGGSIDDREDDGEPVTKKATLGISAK